MSPSSTCISSNKHVSGWIRSIFAATLVLLATCLPGARGQTLQTCLATLNAEDRNNDGSLSSIEFGNFIVAASPYQQVGCPDQSAIGDFLPGGRYYAVFTRVSCFCRDFDSDLTCCDRPSIRLDGAYGPEYLERICADVAAVITSNCAPLHPEITMQPTFAPTAAPSLSPTINIVNNRGNTDAPTEGLATAEPTASPVEFNLPDFEESTAESDDDELFFFEWPFWAQITVPALAATVCFLFGFLVFWYPRSMSSSSRKGRQSSVALKAMVDQGSNNSKTDIDEFPEVLDATDFDDTERTMEEGALIASVGSASPARGAVPWYGNESSSRSNSTSPPPPQSPGRMSQILESLKLEEVKEPSRSSKKVSSSAKKSAVASKTSSTTTSARSSSKTAKAGTMAVRASSIASGNVKKAETRKTSVAATAASTNSGTKKTKARGATTSPPRRSKSKTVEATAAGTDSSPTRKKKKSPKRSKSTPARKPDPRGRILESGSVSSSSAEVFVDSADEISISSGTVESNGQIKWQLMDPTKLVSSGAVEVFPLPPARYHQRISKSPPPRKSRSTSRDPKGKHYR